MWHNASRPMVTRPDLAVVHSASPSNKHIRLRWLRLGGSANSTTTALSVDRRGRSHSEPRRHSESPPLPLSISPSLPPAPPPLVNLATPQHAVATTSMGLEDSTYASRERKFARVFADNEVDALRLRNLCWSGIASGYRHRAWPMMLDVLPFNVDLLDAKLARSVARYSRFVDDIWLGDQGTAAMQMTRRQITLDVPRTHPDIACFQHERIQRAMERVLYIWAIRHPATGYVQGINDLVTPFFYIFLAPYASAATKRKESGDNLTKGIRHSDDDPLSVNDVDNLTDQQLTEVEALSFDCMTKVLGSIQDHYVFAQPGIQRGLFLLEQIIQRIDAPLAAHFKEQGLQFVQFSFRWFNCFLMRELPLPSVVRLWDTYIACGSDCHGFSRFHAFVCAAFLLKFADKLKAIEFQDLVMFLQHLPTSRWTERDIEMLLSQAFVYECLFPPMKSPR